MHLLSKLSGPAESHVCGLNHRQRKTLMYSHFVFTSMIYNHSQLLPPDIRYVMTGNENNMARITMPP